MLQLGKTKLSFFNFGRKYIFAVSTNVPALRVFAGHNIGPFDDVDKVLRKLVVRRVGPICILPLYRAKYFD